MKKTMTEAWRFAELGTKALRQNEARKAQRAKIKQTFSESA